MHIEEFKEKKCVYICFLIPYLYLNTVRAVLVGRKRQNVYPALSHCGADLA